MLKEAIGTGATVDLAKADAIAQLGISADSDFEIEVLEMPTKKMFGLLGTTPAKVKVSYDAPSEAGAKEYLEKILASLGIEGAEIKIEETDEEVSIAVEYDGDYGAAIGRRGETLYPVSRPPCRQQGRGQVEKSLAQHRQLPREARGNPARTRSEERSKGQKVRQKCCA